MNTDLMLTLGIIAGALLVLVVLRRVSHTKHRPPVPQQHEWRFDDTELRDRFAKNRLAARVAWRSPEQYPAVDFPKRERPPERS